MSVLLDTSAGEIVVDLHCDECPLACESFLKLCKLKYYNGCLVFNVQSNYLLQSGDPTGTGKGGISFYGHLYGQERNEFRDEINQRRKMDRLGLLCMSHDSKREHCNTSQFFITLRAHDLEHLDGKHTIFGEVAEGLAVLETLNALYCDEAGRPYQDVRIRHTHVLDDPYPDPAGFAFPASSPERTAPSDEKVSSRIPFEEGVGASADQRTEEEINESIRRKEAQSRAIVLEMTGDIPDADIKPPVEVLFVCKLNPVTTDADLELIFSRFGAIKQCEIIRDSKTGDSLNYAFIEYDSEQSCIKAYEKMNNVLIDDRRVKVDFSQSVSKLWNRFLLKPRKDDKPAPSLTSSPEARASHGDDVRRGSRSRDRGRRSSSRERARR